MTEDNEKSPFGKKVKHLEGRVDELQMLVDTLTDCIGELLQDNQASNTRSSAAMATLAELRSIVAKNSHDALLKRVEHLAQLINRHMMDGLGQHRTTNV